MKEQRFNPLAGIRCFLTIPGAGPGADCPYAGRVSIPLRGFVVF